MGYLRFQLRILNGNDLCCSRYRYQYFISMTTADILFIIEAFLLCLMKLL